MLKHNNWFAIIIFIIFICIPSEIFAQRLKNSSRRKTPAPSNAQRNSHSETSQAKVVAPATKTKEPKPTYESKLTPEQKADIDKTLEEAFKHYRSGNIAKAVQLISLAANLDPGIEPPMTLIAKWMRMDGNIVLTRQMLDQAVISHPEDPEAFFLLASIAQSEKRRTETTLLLARGQELLERYDKHPLRKNRLEHALWLNLANLAEINGDLDSAIACLERSEAVDPENSEIFKKYGVCYMKRNKAGDEQKAFDAFEKAFQLDPQRLPAKAIMAQMTSEKEQVEKLLHEALAEYPEHVGLLSFMAMYYIGQEKIDDAQTIADTLEQKQGNDSLDVQKLQGYLALSVGNLEEAEKRYRHVFKHNQVDMEVRNALALTLFELGGEERYQEALKLAEENVRKAPSQETAAMLAWGFFLTNNQTSLDRLLDQILSQGHLTPNSAFYVAKILMHRDKKDEAVELLQSALNSNTPFVKNNEAKILLQELQKN